MFFFCVCVCFLFCFLKSLDEGNTPVLVAVKLGLVDSLRLLISSGGDLEDITNSGPLEGMNSLMWACSQGLKSCHSLTYSRTLGSCKAPHSRPTLINLLISFCLGRIGY